MAPWSLFEEPWWKSQKPWWKFEEAFWWSLSSQEPLWLSPVSLAARQLDLGLSHSACSTHHCSSLLYRDRLESFQNHRPWCPSGRNRPTLTRDSELNPRGHWWGSTRAGWRSLCPTCSRSTSCKLPQTHRFAPAKGRSGQICRRQHRDWEDFRMRNIGGQQCCLAWQAQPPVSMVHDVAALAWWLHSAWFRSSGFRFCGSHPASSPFSESHFFGLLWLAALRVSPRTFAAQVSGPLFCSPQKIQLDLCCWHCTDQNRRDRLWYLILHSPRCPEAGRLVLEAEGRRWSREGWQCWNTPWCGQSQWLTAPKSTCNDWYKSTTHENQRHTRDRLPPADSSRPAQDHSGQSRCTPGCWRALQTGSHTGDTARGLGRSLLA